MTVKELKAELANIPDDVEVVVEIPINGVEFSKGASIYNHDLMIGEGEDYMAFNVDWWNSKFRTENSESEEQNDN